MKKLRIDPRFWLTAAFCAALLAVPPLLTQARDRQADTSALPRPEAAGVMTDEERLDPTISALYRQSIFSSSDSFLVGDENAHKYTQMSGKLKQANRRGLLSDEQLNVLLALVDTTEAAEAAGEQDEHLYTGLNACVFHTDNSGVEHLELTYCGATPEELASPERALKLDASIFISHLPNNGPILSMTISYDDLPESDMDVETLRENFCDQLNLTIPGEWTATGNNFYSYSSSGLTVYVGKGSAINHSISMFADLNFYARESLAQN